MIYGSSEICILLVQVECVAEVLTTPCGVTISPTAPAEVKIDGHWYSARYGMLPNGTAVVGFAPDRPIKNEFKAKIIFEPYDQHDEEEIYTLDMELVDQEDCPICNPPGDEEDDEDDGDDDDDGPPNRITPYLMSMN